ncbi:MAG: hypothetical protein JWO38_1539 [Gemmataceae bacterium]|nr:hypothetical protein [Gemmataceae bacterium]
MPDRLTTAGTRPGRRPRASWLLAACLFLSSQHPAPGATVDPPFFEPKDGYYKARGKKVEVRWDVDRETVPEDGVLTATLTVRGATNPQEIVRPDLRKVRDDEGRTPFADRFQIEDGPARPVPPGAKEVAFAYHLRPRTRGVTAVPGLDFWYDTGVKVGNPFQKARARGRTITVVAAVKPSPPAVPLVAPDHLLAVAAGPRVLDREPFAAGPGAWLVLAAAAPLAAVGWYAAWRQVYPDAARLARIRRSRAVRRAMDAIRRAGRAADPAGVIATALLGYLRTRFPLPPGAETPAEVGEGLRAAGLPAETAGEAVAVLRRCDEARFAPAGETGPSLAAGAEALITRLEEVE